MAYLNKAQLIGNLGADPELREFDDGKCVVKFRVASTEPWGEKETLWVDVAAWDKRARTAKQYLHKGDRVLVEGRLSIEEWEDKEGRQRQSVVIKANDIQFLTLKSESSQGQQTQTQTQQRPQQQQTRDEIPF